MYNNETKILFGTVKQTEENVTTNEWGTLAEWDTSKDITGLFFIVNPDIDLSLSQVRLFTSDNIQVWSSTVKELPKQKLKIHNITEDDTVYITTRVIRREDLEENYNGVYCATLENPISNTSLDTSLEISITGLNESITVNNVFDEFDEYDEHVLDDNENYDSTIHIEDRGNDSLFSVNNEDEEIDVAHKSDASFRNENFDYSSNSKLDIADIFDCDDEDEYVLENEEMSYDENNYTVINTEELRHSHNEYPMEVLSEIMKEADKTMDNYKLNQISNYLLSNLTKDQLTELTQSIVTHTDIVLQDSKTQLDSESAILEFCSKNKPYVVNCIDKFTEIEEYDIVIEKLGCRYIVTVHNLTPRAIVLFEGEMPYFTFHNSIEDFLLKIEDIICRTYGLETYEYNDLRKVLLVTETDILEHSENNSITCISRSDLLRNLSLENDTTVIDILEDKVEVVHKTNLGEVIEAICLDMKNTNKINFYQSLIELIDTLGSDSTKIIGYSILPEIKELINEESTNKYLTSNTLGKLMKQKAVQEA